MNTDYIFTISPNVYDYGDVLPEDCKKEQVGLGAVPDEKCEIYPTPYIDVIFNEGNEPQIGWVLGYTLPVILA